MPEEPPPSASGTQHPDAATPTPEAKQPTSLFSTSAGGNVGPPGNGFSFSAQSSSSFIGARSANVGIGLAPAPAKPPPRFTLASPSAVPDLELEVHSLRAGGQEARHIKVSGSATVADVRAQLPAGPLTILFAGTPLTCPTERLAELGVRSGQKLTCIPKASAETGPLGRSLAPSQVATGPSAPPSGTGNGKQAAGSSAATAPAAASPFSTSGGGSSADSAPTQSEIRVRVSASGKTLAFPYEARMTGMGLKRALDARGEGEAAALRLIAAGKELHDDLPLEAQRVTPGLIIIMTRRQLPLVLNSRFASGGTLAASGGQATGRREGGWVGLRNQGATCYLNSLVQSLFMTPCFRSSVLELTSEVEVLPAVPKALSQLFCALRHSQTAVSTETLTNALRWGPVSRQQDVHEFWTMLCERIEADLKGSAYASLVEDTFQGDQLDYVRCEACGTTSNRKDCFQDLKLVVPADGASDVPSALRAMLRPETMTGDEQYQCDKCGKKRDATRGVRLTRLPTVLTLQLKRFRYDLRTGQRHKISTAFDFPTHLDMAEYVTAASAQEPAAIAAQGEAGEGEDGAEPRRESAASSATSADDAEEIVQVDASVVDAMELDTTETDGTIAVSAVDLSGGVGGAPAGAVATLGAAGCAAGGVPAPVPSVATGPPLDPVDCADATGESIASSASAVGEAAPTAKPAAKGSHGELEEERPTSGTVEAADGAGELPRGRRPSMPYELYAVLVHQGSASFGHYYALIQDLAHGEWFEFNDSTVKPIKASELKRAVGGAVGGSWSGGGTSAYMLLYRKVDDHGARLGAPRLAEGASTQDANGAAHTHELSGSPHSREHRRDLSGEGLAHETKRLRLTPPHSSSNAARIASEEVAAENDNPYARMDG